MIDTLLNIIAPHVCVACGREGSLLCIDCGKKCISSKNECFTCFAPLVRGEMCASCCNNHGIRSFTSVGWYQDDLKKAVYDYKFKTKRGGATALAGLLAQVVRVHPGLVVTYVPTTAQHIKERGFDHAKLLAQAFAARQSLYCIAALARTNNHRQLGKSKAQRQTTIQGSFVAIHTSSFKGSDVLLIDDVMTTGATLREAASVLRMAGARHVHTLVIAKTPHTARPNR